MDNVFNAPNTTPVAGTANSPVPATSDTDDDLATISATNTADTPPSPTPPLDDTASKTPDKPSDDAIKFESWDNADNDDTTSADSDKISADAALAEGNENPLGETGINDAAANASEFADKEEATDPVVEDAIPDSTPATVSSSGSIDELEKELNDKKSGMDAEIAKIEENKKKIDDALAKIADLKSKEEEIRQIASGL